MHPTSTIATNIDKLVSNMSDLNDFVYLKIDITKLSCYLYRETCKARRASKYKTVSLANEYKQFINNKFGIEAVPECRLAGK